MHPFAATGGLGTAGASFKGALSGFRFVGRGARSIGRGIGNLKVPVYRVYGGASRINGFSWTPINPKLLPTRTFRNYAGLPNANWGTRFIKGNVRTKNIIEFRRALPAGRKGGLPEFIINPNNINMWRYMKRPGLYKSYWGY